MIICFGQGGVARHIQNEARGMDVLVLWLDCDREGENICFEVCSSTRVVAPIDILMVKVMENAQPYMNHHGKYIFRAKFSGKISWSCQFHFSSSLTALAFAAIAHSDIMRALNTLTVPNKFEALSVDARQEIDLKGRHSFPF